MAETGHGSNVSNISTREGGRDRKSHLQLHIEFETAWTTSESATKRKTENKNGKRGVEQGRIKALPILSKSGGTFKGLSIPG